MHLTNQECLIISSALASYRKEVKRMDTRARMITNVFGEALDALDALKAKIDGYIEDQFSTTNGETSDK